MMNHSKKIFMLSCVSISLLAGLSSTAHADGDGWGRFGVNLFLGAPAYYAPPVYVPQPAYGYYGPPAPPPAYYGPPGPPPGYYNGGYGGDGGYGRGRWGRGREDDDD